MLLYFFFIATATTEIYTLSLHDALPISIADCFLSGITRATAIDLAKRRGIEVVERRIMPDELNGFTECFVTGTAARSEEHTSELQSQSNLVCRLLLEKKKRTE